ncbi:MAG: dienelactone hydrolase family protein [Frankia sp.]|nr:dienelactone hydrolase family protein [Frankia sp.]
MDVYLYAPEAAGDGPLPTVIMYADAGGVRPVSREMAAQLASHGYLVALPNVFYRAGEFAPFDMRTVFGDEKERARLYEVMKTAGVPAVMRDTGALLAALAEVPGARADRVGTIGYCMGGRLSFAAAGAFPDVVAAAASFHGGRLAVEDDPDSPHHQAGRVRARLYFGVADNDNTCTPEDQARLAATLDQAGVDYRMELFEGKLHGFAVPDLPVHDEEAAKRHWDRALELFDAVLR